MSSIFGGKLFSSSRGEPYKRMKLYKLSVGSEVPACGHLLLVLVRPLRGGRGRRRLVASDGLIWTFWIKICCRRLNICIGNHMGLSAIWGKNCTAIGQ